ncbi:MAG: polysaccharide biosynthesis tyrosine autokinase [Cyanobacteria bacterium J06633_8]
MIHNNSSQASDNNPDKYFPSPLLANESISLTRMESNDWDLNPFLMLLKRRALIIAGVVTATMAVVTYNTLTEVDQYKSDFRLLVEPIDENDKSDLSNLVSPGKADYVKPNLDYETQIAVLKSPELINNIVQELGGKYKNVTYEHLRDTLEINRLGESKIIEVTYQDASPTQIKDILDAVAKNYLEYSLEKRQTQLNQGIRFVNSELPPIKAEVDKLQKQLQDFRQEYNFFEPETESEQINQKFQELFERRQIVKQQLANAKANLARLQDEEGALAVLKDATVYQNLVIQLQELEAKIAEESTRFQEDAPVMQRLKEKRQKLIPLLQREGQRILNITLADAKNKVEALEVELQQFSPTEQKFNQRIKELPAIARRYSDLQQNLKLANESLNRFLAARQNLQIQAAQTELPWEMIKAPVKPQNPVSPNIQRNLILGFAASILLGLGAALVKEKLDKTYRNVNKLKNDLKLPLLGTLPIHNDLKKDYKNYLKAESAINDYSQKPSKFVESLRVVYTNLQMSNRERPIRSIVISSALDRDGKSAVGYNLARVAASMGQKVLLVDANLRDANLSADIKLNNQLGLSNLITENLLLEEVIQELPGMPECSIIASGSIPSDATKLITSPQMKSLAEEFERRFDLVIYDAPPVVGLADATLLAPLTDGMMLVVRMDRTNRSILQQTLDSLNTSRTNVLGVVANGDRSVVSKY